MVGRDVSGRGGPDDAAQVNGRNRGAAAERERFAGPAQAAFEFQRRGGKAKRETISTRHILFVVSGAFERLKQQVSRRLTQGQNRV